MLYTVYWCLKKNATNLSLTDKLAFLLFALSKKKVYFSSRCRYLSSGMQIMVNELKSFEYFVEPGFICLPKKESTLYAVTGSGIVVTLYDRARKTGGMSYFFRPSRPSKTDNQPAYALPAIAGILKMLISDGSTEANLEAQIFGGADNPKIAGYQDGLAAENIRAVFTILKRKNITVSSFDVGSKRGRKIAFNSFTGETVVAKVNNIRKKDWYPVLV